MTRMTERLARAALISACVASSAASAAEPCLQPREAEDLVVFVLPALMEAMARKCSPLLPANATLSRSGTALSMRYRPESSAAWPSAKLAFDKISGGDTLSFLSEDVNRAVIEQASSAAIVAEFKAKDCTMVDRFVGALSPLPARNVAQLVSLFMEIGGKEEKSPMNICPAGAPK